MSGPTIGIGRITIPYTVSGLTHVSRMYVDSPHLSAGAWFVNLRPGAGTDAAWEAAAQGFADCISSVLATGVTPGTALLEEYSATGWLPRDTAAVTFPNLAGNTNQASEVVLTLRDSNFTRPKIVVMEINQVAPAKFTSPTGGAGGLDGFIDGFLSTGSGTSRPWLVMVNQHGFFLQDTAFVSARLGYNRKIERARGLA